MKDDLIQSIVRQLLSEPAFQAILQRHGIVTPPGTSNPPRKPDRLVLLNYVPDLGTVLNRLRERWGATHTLHLLPSESVLKAQPDLPEGLRWITPQEALSRAAWQSILLPTCSLNTLAKMALGIRDNPSTELLGRGLAQGTPIELITESFGLSDQTPPAYRDLYDGYLQKVQSYGVRVYATLDTLDREGPFEIQTLREADKPILTQPQQVRPVQNVLRFTKKYLADKDAYSFPEDSKVLIPQRIVISPLARDTLRMRRIELCQEREEQRQCY